LGFFEDGHPKKKKKNNNKVSSDMRSVPDPKITLTMRALDSELCTYIAGQHSLLTGKVMGQDALGPFV